MLAKPGPPRSPRPSLHRIAATLQLGGWLGFWVQLALGLAAILLLLIVVPGILFGQTPGQGATVGIFWAICAAIVIGFNISLSFRYTRIARGLTQRGQEPQPKKAETLHLLRLGVYAGIIGTILALIGSGVSSGVLVAKAVSQPPGMAITDPTKIVRALDVFVVVANLAGITANFFGMVMSLWLFDRIERPGNS